MQTFIFFCLNFGTIRIFCNKIKNFYFFLILLFMRRQLVSTFKKKQQNRHLFLIYFFLGGGEAYEGASTLRRAAGIKKSFFLCFVPSANSS